MIRELMLKAIKDFIIIITVITFWSITISYILSKV